MRAVHGCSSPATLVVTATLESIVVHNRSQLEHPYVQNNFCSQHKPWIYINLIKRTHCVVHNIPGSVTPPSLL